MPIKKAGKKALRTSQRNHKINQKIKADLNSSIKKFNELIKDNKIEEAKKELNKCYKTLDKAAKKNVIKKNTASRKKSRLTKALNKSGKTKKTAKK